MPCNSGASCSPIAERRHRRTRVPVAGTSADVCVDSRMQRGGVPVLDAALQPDEEPRMHIAQAVRTIVPLGLAAALSGAGCGGDDFTLSSPDVANGGSIQKAQVFTGCDGGNVSPTLNWSNPPEGTQSFTVTIYDADAPTGSGFWH